MLVVSRREGEQVRIIAGGEEIVVRVIDTGTSVRLGIDAPRSVRIYREEVWDAIRAENQAAAQAPAGLPRLPR